MLTGEVPFKGENQVAVAMKHVREILPDVQAKRPEVSAALASVVDTATAKRPEDRYANDVELIADLEDVLAIETARAGSATGEVTTVLRTLPSSTQRRIPFTLRHRLVAVLLLVLVLAGVGGVAVWLATRTHHGPGKLVQPPPPAAHTQVQLCQSCAFGYNPLGTPHTEHPDAPLAIDSDTTTAWTTQDYYSGQLGKAGVGIYVDARPGTVARDLRIVTKTPGFAAQVYVRNSPPNVDHWDPGPNGWIEVGSVGSVKSRQDFRLSTQGTKYRYYLVWITALGAHTQIAINEIALYR
jgi:serine/threonine-protein kinase